MYAVGDTPTARYDTERGKVNERLVNLQDEIDELRRQAEEMLVDHIHEKKSSFVERDQDFSSDVHAAADGLVHYGDDFYDYLIQQKQEHEKRLSELERMYNEKLARHQKKIPDTKKPDSRSVRFKDEAGAPGEYEYSGNQSYTSADYEDGYLSSTGSADTGSTVEQNAACNLESLGAPVNPVRPSAASHLAPPHIVVSSRVRPKKEVGVQADSQLSLRNRSPRSLPSSLSSQSYDPLFPERGYSSDTEAELRMRSRPSLHSLHPARVRQEIDIRVSQAGFASDRSSVSPPLPSRSQALSKTPSPMRTSETSPPRWRGPFDGKHTSSLPPRNEYVRSASSSPVRMSWDSVNSGVFPMARHAFSHSPSLDGMPGTTTPKPFSFSKREKLRNGLRTQSITKEKRDLYLQSLRHAEDKELSTRVYARPVPRAVYGPSYVERLEDEALEREKRAEERAVLLLSTADPPSCYDPTPRRVYSPERDRPDSSRQFQASPIAQPVRIIAASDTRKMDQESELDRRRRIKQRAEELYEQSRLPPRLHMYEQTVGPQHRRMLQEAWSSAGLGPEHTFQPNISEHVPDFGKLQRRFYHQLNEKKHSGSITVPEMFRGYRERSKRLQEIHQLRSYRSALKDAEEAARVRDMRWPFTPAPPPAIPVEPSTPPPVLGKDACYCDRRRMAGKPLPCGICKRKEKVDKLLQDREQKRLREEEEDRQRKQRVKAMTHRISPLVSSFGSDREQRIASKTKDLRGQAKEFEESQKQRTDELKEKARKTPFLFQRLARDRAKELARKKFEQKIEEHGVERLIDENQMNDI